jgi:hypothetical protein
MQLVYLGAKLDTTQEHELNYITPKGFRVLIQYVENSGYGEREIFENCTEVHYLFKNSFNEKSVAFESDIKSTGFTRDIKHIKSINITLMAEPSKNQVFETKLMAMIKKQNMPSTYEELYYDFVNDNVKELKEIIDIYQF